ncbi:MAG: ABC transporter permease [Proteobacteria bacterium]|nr:ABC transporter permease [Pseudomonadota bacterium]
MTKLITIAFRNLLRNTRRSLLTVAAIAFGLGMMVFSITFATGSYDQMTRKGVSQMAGHVVVQAPGYQEDKDPALMLVGSESAAATLRSTFPEATVTQRMQLAGLLTSSATSVGAGIAGYEPSQEAKISDFDDKIVDGEWLADDDQRGIVIGARMAEQLDVDLGDKVVYMGQQEGQTEVQSRLFRVRGVFKTGSAEMDGFLALVHIGAARELMTTEDSAHQIAVHLLSANQSLEASGIARDALGRDDLDVLNWKQALPELFAMIQVDKQSNDFLMAIIGIIVALGVLNTVLMSVLERTREFGVLMAVGMSKRAVAILVLLEGAALGVVGTLAGVALGFLPSWYVVNEGIDMSGYLGDTMDQGGVVMSTMIYGAWDPPRLLNYAIAALVLSILAAAWPAWRVTRLQPVDAMRHH